MKKKSYEENKFLIILIYFRFKEEEQLDMSVGLSVSTHFHVSESWKCMRNECYLKDINIFLNNLLKTCSHLFHYY